jgi:hypothetical protein
VHIDHDTDLSLLAEITRVEKGWWGGGGIETTVGLSVHCSNSSVHLRQCMIVNNGCKLAEKNLIQTPMIAERSSASLHFSSNNRYLLSSNSDLKHENQFLSKEIWEPI